MSTANKKESTKGKRYSASQKKEVVDFVEKYNADNGRGGQSAAAAKFGVSQLTISSWLKSSGAPALKKGAKGVKGAKAAKGASKGGINAKLSSLLALGTQIEKAEKELAQLKAKFNSIKASL